MVTAMLKLTRLNDEIVAVNPDHICLVDASPDTRLHLFGGENIIVKETIDELIEKLVDYRRRVHTPVMAMTLRQEGDAT